MVRIINYCRSARTVVMGASLALLLIAPVQSDAATAKKQIDLVKTARDDVFDDVAAVAAYRPRPCRNPKQVDSPIKGWRADEPLCAWQNHLQIRRWQAASDTSPPRCVSKQATWWAAGMPNNSPTAAKTVWNRAWTSQSMIDDTSAEQSIAIVRKTRKGSWIATEWRWTPSSRAATRQWQTRRWKLLTDLAQELRQTAPESLRLKETGPLAIAWRKTLNGRPAEILADSWIWQQDDLCMQMEIAQPSQAQLHLPYSKEEWRLEQRSAMQLLLARAYPNAKWLTPFKLLSLPVSTPTSGAKYEAIWREDGMVKGQLWMPVKVDGGILRGRISVALPPKKDADADAAVIASVAASIDRELIGIATSMVLDNER